VLLSVNPNPAMKKAFTMFEILIVVLIVGIITAIALPNFMRSKESSLGEEANLTLKLIQDAEQFYHIEHDAYINSTNISDINSKLKLYIPTSESRSWDYKIITPDAHNFTAKANRLTSNPDYIRTYCINQSADEPYSDSCSW